METPLSYKLFLLQTVDTCRLERFRGILDCFLKSYFVCLSVFYFNFEPTLNISISSSSSSSLLKVVCTQFIHRSTAFFLDFMFTVN